MQRKIARHPVTSAARLGVFRRAFLARFPHHATNRASRQWPQAVGTARRGAPAPSVTPDARRSGIPESIRNSIAVALPPRSSRFQVRRAGLLGGLPAGRSGIRQLRRQLELARSGMDADQSADRARTPQPAPLLWRELQGRMPDGSGQLLTLLEIAEEIARQSLPSSGAGPTEGARSMAAPGGSTPTRIGTT
jgi:hypothetical protein